MKYYFVSDIHLGLPPEKEAKEREIRFVNWLDSIKHSAAEIFLLGDIFDFWFEYKTVIPKGFSRTFGKIAELTDAGIPVHFFAGNHDLWIRNYFSAELGMIIHNHDYYVEICEKKFYMVHGDALNPGDKRHMRLRTIFTNRILYKMYSLIHPRFGLALGNKWSISNRKKHVELKFEQDNPFYSIATEKAGKEGIDIFIIGHIHTPVHLQENGFEFIALPDWLSGRDGYAAFDNGTIDLYNVE